MTVPGAGGGGPGRSEDSADSSDDDTSGSRRGVGGAGGGGGPDDDDADSNRHGGGLLDTKARAVAFQLVIMRHFRPRASLDFAGPVRGSSKRAHPLRPACTSRS